MSSGSAASRTRDIALLGFSLAAPLPWLALHFLASEEPGFGVTAAATGGAILGAAFLLS